MLSVRVAAFEVGVKVANEIEVGLIVMPPEVDPGDEDIADANTSGTVTGLSERAKVGMLTLDIVATV